MTTAPAPAQESTLYGPDGRPLTRPASQPAEETPRPSTPAGDWKPVTTQDNATVWEKTAPTQTDGAARPEISAYQQAGINAHQTRIDELEARISVMDSAHSPRQAKEVSHSAAPKPPMAKPTPETGKSPAKTGETKKSAIDRFGPWVALLAAVALTASGEYGLASLVGFPAGIAWALPTAIDVYVIQAIRRHRDVPAAIILSIASNALDALARVRLFGVTSTGHPVWWLIVSVVAIAPLIVWRVHRITETRPAKRNETTARNAPFATVAAARETTVAPGTVAATATPRETVRATLPERSTTPSETATATQTPIAPATAERAPEQRETARVARNATPRPRPTATPRETTSPVATPRETTSPVATPINRNAQLDIVGRFVDAWNGPDEKLPLQPIADALGRSKPTASRLVREYRNAKSA